MIRNGREQAEATSMNTAQHFGPFNLGHSDQKLYAALRISLAGGGNKIAN